MQAKQNRLMLSSAVRRFPSKPGTTGFFVMQFIPIR
jgi:hypothetical protein